MVLAELPLWVVHSTSSASGANGILSSSGAAGAAAVKGDGISSSFANSSSSNLERARDSLSLLAEGLDGGIQKCAIYSIDIHPSGQKFATGGGDGTVRIWNSSALFKNQPSQQQQPQDQPKVGRYGDKGVYVSSGESSAEDNGGPGSSGNEGNGDASRDQNDEGGSAREEDAMEEDEEDVVHDLSSLVRRKKDGTASSPSKLVASASNQHQHPKHGTSQQDRLLCTLSAHTGSSVLAVRFSTNGQYLASAGDDAIVCIYAPSKSSTTASAGNLDHSAVEHWSRIKLCRGHALDAVGLAWAPDDSHLVSCSLDSNAPIIVWKLTDLAVGQRPTHANVLCNPYKILGRNIHTSTVKGVTFDPAGTYLASSGDDPSVCVWRAYDDWGLEKRVDASTGIFRRWKEGDAHALSSQTLFRRLSWATDGAYICSTNSVVKNKHVASTISREGWGVSSAKSVASGAAHLVGHKQPVVVSRHSPFLLDARKEPGQGDEEEPEYATLLALGDKRGFVTVWSTRQSRPIFKLQCSESRCTVTDLAWGRKQRDLMLLVSLLDGQVVALLFRVPDELGRLLKPSDQARVFQLRYGIDLNDVGERGLRRLFVGENSGPKLIENALQYTLEDRDEEEDEEESSDNDQSSSGGDRRPVQQIDNVLAAQSESTGKGGKKRIRPVLMRVDDDNTIKKSKSLSNGGGEKKVTKKKSLDPLQDAMEAAQKAVSGAEAATTQKTRQEAPGETSVSEQQEHHPNGIIAGQRQAPVPIAAVHTATPQIPHSTDRIHTVELPIPKNAATAALLETNINGVGGQGSTTCFVADCTNAIQVPARSAGSALSCATLTISRNGHVMWRDQLPGSSCCAMAACQHLLAVGTSDGCVQLYGTSPTLGWASGASFRSHPPLVFGSPIVALQLQETRAMDESNVTQIEMLVVDADGKFGVYQVVPSLKIRCKGSIMAPMTHMSLSADMSKEIHLPKLARIQIAETKRLLLILSLHTPQGGRSAYNNNSDEGNRSRNNGLNMSDPAVGAGGSLQAFVYNELAELWMRVSDSRFVLSDFYSTLPSSISSSSKKKKSNEKSIVTPPGELAGYDDTVRMGAAASNLKPSRRGGGSSRASGGHADAAYHQAVEETDDDMATRSHCEDRMACAIALGSTSEFEQWLSLYVQTLSISGHEALLRLLVDMLLSRRGKNGGDGTVGTAMEVSDGDTPRPGPSLECCNCWWLSEAPGVLGLERKTLVRSLVIPEMSKNRALQRLTNEIAIEIDSL
jgi:protein HIRA/HIR1